MNVAQTLSLNGQSTGRLFLLFIDDSFGVFGFDEEYVSIKLPQKEVQEQLSQLITELDIISLRSSHPTCSH